MPQHNSVSGSCGLRRGDLVVGMFHKVELKNKSNGNNEDGDVENVSPFFWVRGEKQFKSLARLSIQLNR